MGDNIGKEYNKKKIIKILMLIFLAFCVTFGIIKLIQSIPKKELISTKTYDVYELTLVEDGNYDYVYYSYVDENQKINKDRISGSELLHLVYLGEKNQVTIENWGRNNEVSKIILIKFCVTEETYKNFSEKFSWEKQSNI